MTRSEDAREMELEFLDRRRENRRATRPVPWHLREAFMTLLLTAIAGVCGYFAMFVIDVKSDIAVLKEQGIETKIQMREGFADSKAMQRQIIEQLNAKQDKRR